MVEHNSYVRQITRLRLVGNAAGVMSLRNNVRHTTSTKYVGSGLVTKILPYCLEPSPVSHKRMDLFSRGVAAYVSVIDARYRINAGCRCVDHVTPGNPGYGYTSQLVWQNVEEVGIV